MARGGGAEALVDGVVARRGEAGDGAVEADERAEGIPLAAVDAAEGLAVRLVEGLQHRLHRPRPVLPAHVFEAAEDEEPAHVCARAAAPLPRGLEVTSRL